MKVGICGSLLISVLFIFSACSNKNSVSLDEYTRAIEERESLKAELQNTVPKSEYEDLMEQNEKLREEIESLANVISAFESSAAEESYNEDEAETHSSVNETDTVIDQPESNAAIFTDETNVKWSEEQYSVIGNGVNVRYANNRFNIYTQLSDGTVIGHIADYEEDGEWVLFIMDGIEVIIKRDHIKPIN